MRTATFLAFAAGLATNHAAAQDCLWTYHSSALPVVSSTALYHSGLERILLVNTDHASGVRIWAWEDGTWLLISESGPIRRFHSPAVYDSTRDRIVLFGGNTVSSGVQGDTWEWDGAAWHQRIVAGPPARERHGMVYDPLRMRTVLFGGRLPPGIALNDTWEWDGNAWMQVATGGPPGPGPSGVRTMVYDPVRARSLLATGSALWEWDGSAWLQRPALSFPSAMAFDSATNRLLVFGAGVWEVNTVTGQWLQRQSDPVPSGRAAFDVRRSRTVLVSQNRTDEFNTAGTILSPYFTQLPAGGGHFAPGATITLTIQASGTPPLTYQWRRDQQPLADGGPISGATTDTLIISPASGIHSGNYDAVVANSCLALTSFFPTYVEVRSSTCYPNCDESTTPPILNVLDFTCFLQRFAAGHLYANCDPGQLPPILNVADFGCFITKFAAGCP
jgi:hypothetical protein